jgi:aryl-alcohol dehydrogenase-like predicted oxidoreductase
MYQCFLAVLHECHEVVVTEVYHTFQEREMIPYCKAHGIGYIPWSPIAAGALARPVGTETARTTAAKGTVWEKKFSEAEVEIITRVQKLSEKKSCTMAQVAIAWVMTKVTSPIVGVSSVERLEQNIVHGIEITEEDANFLEEP